MQFIATSFADICVEDTGPGGGAIVLLHGNSSCKEVFQHQLDALGHRRRMIAVDLPGHGASSDAIEPTRTYTLPGFAECVIEVLEKLGVSPAIVVGWSLGGHIALEMTARTDSVAGLLMAGAPPFEIMPDGSVAGFRPTPGLGFAAQEKLAPSQIEEFARLSMGMDDERWIRAFARADGFARRRVFEASAEQPPDRQKRLAEQCRVPLAIVNGADDDVVDLAYIGGIDYGNLWSGRMIIIEGQGHAVHYHAAVEFNAILDQFAADVFLETPAG